MQHRFLIRASGLAPFRRALVERSLAGPAPEIRRRVVIVPTQASAELLRQTVEAEMAAGGRRAMVLPNFITRDEWLGLLAAAIPGHARLLTRLEREVLMERASAEVLALRRWDKPPFAARPGLIAAMLDFYDELKRRQRTVRRFARTLFDELRVEGGMDRGSEELIHQTCFMGYSFLAYERAAAASGDFDEHGMRAQALDLQPSLPFDHVVIAVADHPSDPRGLWPADFDTVGRLRHVRQIDVVMTDEAHDAGFRERLEQELPGVEERRVSGASSRPSLVVPTGATVESAVFISRDREEEVRAIARAIRARTAGRRVPLSSIGIVFQRPLPYLYLAQQVLDDARVPYQAFDALPLAAEPYAALLDLVLTVARTGGTRESIVAILRSPLLQFREGGDLISGRDAAALDRVLSERRAVGDATTYSDEVLAFFGDRPVRDRIDAARARRAAAAAGRIGASLAPFRDAATASEQTAAVRTFLRQHERPRAGGNADDRFLRARAAVLGVADGLIDAYRRHDDRRRESDDIIARLHHALENHTFTPRRGAGGVHLVDAVAARFGEFDDVFLVGLVEGDWPERVRRTIFYSSGLLKALGWPQESDAARAQRAAFVDLLSLAGVRLRLSAFQLEGDSIVTPSPLIEMAAALPTTPEEADGTSPPPPLFSDELLTSGASVTGLDGGVSAWLDLRRDRPPTTSASYRGSLGPLASRAYRVSAVDQYVACPFKYLSQHVLGLPEEREEGAGLTPLERGTLLHSLFEQFYQRWNDERGGAIKADSLSDALAIFTDITRSALAPLPAADRALEETRLLGSLVERGVAERVFDLEVESGQEIATRLLERNLTGPFTFPAGFGLGNTRQIEIRGKADRIDVFDDGRLRIVDYKLGRMPDLDSSLQVAVYAHCARSSIEASDGRAHPVAEAMYLAFADDRRLEGPLAKPDEMTAALSVRISAFVATIDAIEGGHFPSRPKRVGDCQWCRYAGVCRKEYLLDDDDSAASV